MTGCTAIGFIADVAIIEAIEDKKAPSRQQDLPLTEMGLQADVAFVGELVGEFGMKKDFAKSDELKRDSSQFSGKCPRKLEKNEVCYSAEYYAKFREQLDSNTHTDSGAQNADSVSKN